MPRRLSTTLALLAPAACASIALAQPAGQPTGAELERVPSKPAKPAEPDAPAGQGGNGLAFDLKAWTEHVFRADVHDSQADVAITRFGGQFGISGPIGERWRWNVEAAAEASWYDFSRLSSLVGVDDPVEDVLQITLTPSLLYRHSDSLSFLAGGIIQFSGEPDADVSDTATYGGFFGSRWKISDSFSLQLGAAVKTRLEENVRFFPAIGFQWQINERVMLATEGAGLRLSADLNPQWTFFLEGGYALREFRLDHRDSGPLDEGVFRDERVTIGAGFDYKPSLNTTISLTGGAAVWSQFRFDNRDGIEIAEEEADPTAYVGLTVRFRF